VFFFVGDTFNWSSRNWEDTACEGTSYLKESCLVSCLLIKNDVLLHVCEVLAVPRIAVLHGNNTVLCLASKTNFY
jgi:hypothetical protein